MYELRNVRVGWIAEQYNPRRQDNNAMLSNFINRHGAHIFLNNSSWAIILLTLKRWQNQILSERFSVCIIPSGVLLCNILDKHQTFRLTKFSRHFTIVKYVLKWALTFCQRNKPKSRENGRIKVEAYLQGSNNLKRKDYIQYTCHASNEIGQNDC